MNDDLAVKKIQGLKAELLRATSIIKMVQSWAEFDINPNRQKSQLKALDPKLVIELCRIVTDPS